MFDKGSVNCNILTFNKGSNLLDTIKAHLDAHHVYYSISTMEWGLIDFQKKGIDWAIRLSPHYFNTMDEIDRVSEIIEAL
jgi:selenocysteine lyase/cysteine desulfurase